jgi:hypothetical protein
MRSRFSIPREERFDRITRTAVRLFRMPKSLLAFVDETRAWVKSEAGTSIDWVPRESSFSQLAIESDEPVVVPDARNDPRFVDHPLVVGPDRIRLLPAGQWRVYDFTGSATCSTSSCDLTCARSLARSTRPGPAGGAGGGRHSPSCPGPPSTASGAVAPAKRKAAVSTTAATQRLCRTPTRSPRKPTAGGPARKAT